MLQIIKQTYLEMFRKNKFGHKTLKKNIFNKMYK